MSFEVLARVDRDLSVDPSYIIRLTVPGAEDTACRSLPHPKLSQPVLAMVNWLIPLSSGRIPLPHPAPR